LPSLAQWTQHSHTRFPPAERTNICRWPSPLQVRSHSKSRRIRLQKRSRKEVAASRNLPRTVPPESREQFEMVILVVRRHLARLLLQFPRAILFNYQEQRSKSSRQFSIQRPLKGIPTQSRFSNHVRATEFPIKSLLEARNRSIKAQNLSCRRLPLRQFLRPLNAPLPLVVVHHTDYRVPSSSAQCFPDRPAPHPHQVSRLQGFRDSRIPTATFA